MASNYGSDDGTASEISLDEDKKSEDIEEEIKKANQDDDDLIDIVKLQQYWSDKYIHDCSNDKWFVVKVIRKSHKDFKKNISKAK